MTHDIRAIAQAVLDHEPIGQNEVYALAARLAEVEAELKRCADHLKAWVEMHPQEATAETMAILHCAALAQPEGKRHGG